MFRAQHCNKRLFFTQPSLAFFDATQGFNKPREKLSLTPHNYISTIQQYVKDDWRAIPQPRPASSVQFLFVNKNNKVMGRIRPPMCAAFPRAEIPEGGLSKQQIIDFHSDENNDGTWLLCCTERAIGNVIVKKDGSIDDGTLAQFSLLVDYNRAAGSGANNTKNNNYDDYDDPGFIRPGPESPMYQEFFSWTATMTPKLESCINWVARRDEPDHITWDHLKQMQRFSEKEHRLNLASSSASSGGEDAASSGEGGENSETSSNNSIDDSMFETDTEKFGGHEIGSAQAAAAASQWASERISLLDQKKWLIIPPKFMHSAELKVSRRLPNEINMMGAVGRLRMGMLELL